jgi:dTDP-4-amino-4,6-dideoxygalactose transaminase
MLERLDGVQATCRRNARHLIDLTAEFTFVDVPTIARGAEPAFLRLPVLVDSQARASRLFDLLVQEGIGVSRSYGLTVAEMYTNVFPFEESDYPGASRVARCLLTLPTHAYLEDTDLVRLAGAFCAARQTGD